MSSIPSLIIAQAQAQGVDPSLALEVGNVESGFNQNAVSPAGAIGVMQLMPATAASLGVDPTNLEENIQGGVTYLAQLLAEFGDPSAALAAYNWGPSNVSNLIATYGSNWLGYAPASVQSYVNTILANQASEYASVVGVAPTAAPTSTATIYEASLIPTSLGDIDWTTVGIAFVFIIALGFALNEL